MMKKILTSIIIMVVVIVAFNTFSNAAALQATISITPDKTEVAPGDLVTFTLKLTNVANAKDDCVGAVEGYIQYDTNFFEYIDSLGLTVSTVTGHFSAYPNGSTIGNITLKVKSNATETGTVKFTGLKADDGRDDTTQSSATTPDVPIDIKIKETTEQPSTNQGTTGGNTEEKISTDQDPTKSPTTDEDPTKSPTNPGSTDSPSTGDSKGEIQSPTTSGDSTGNQSNNEQQNPITGVAQDGNKEQTQNDQKPATNEEQKLNSSNEVKSTGENSESKTALPNTGLPTGIIAVIVVGIATGIFYTRLKKYKDVK